MAKNAVFHIVKKMKKFALITFERREIFEWEWVQVVGRVKIYQTQGRKLSYRSYILSKGHPKFREKWELCWRWARSASGLV